MEFLHFVLHISLSYFLLLLCHYRVVLVSLIPLIYYLVMLMNIVVPIREQSALLFYVPLGSMLVHMISFCVLFSCSIRFFIL